MATKIDLEPTNPETQRRLTDARALLDDMSGESVIEKMIGVSPPNLMTCISSDLI